MAHGLLDALLTRRDLLRGVAGAALAGALSPARAQPRRRPNIVILLADDLGYADLGCQGCRDIATPHCDRLAAGGVRCLDGHSNHPVCAPTRAALMTGLYQHRFGFEHNPGPEDAADPDFGLPRDVPTLAERLKAAGYATGMVGKWHIGFREGLRPHERGFDTHFGFLGGAHGYLPGRRDAAILRDGEPVTETEYLTDAFAREAAAYIGAHAAEPFFLYCAFNAVHSPLEAPDDYQNRNPGITDTRRRTYSGMLTALDDAVGRILGKIDDHGLADDTLVIFFSDNGGPTQQTSSRNDPLRGSKGQMFEGGHRVPFLLRWPGHLPAGTTYPSTVAGFDVHATALAVAGVTAERPLDGVNLLPHLAGELTTPPHDRLFWRSGEQHAARLGDWKLVRVTTEPRPLLFNLADDIGEQTDRAAAEPARLAEMQAAFDTWSADMADPRWVRQDNRAGAGANANRRFQRLDRNGDGVLTADEVPQAGLFRRLDADGDGKVTREEARAGQRQ